MTTGKKQDINQDNRKKWMEQIEDVFNGKPLLCPVCNKRTGRSVFYFFPDDVGYCTVECNDCGSWMSLIDRIIRSDKIKAEVEDLLEEIP